MRRTVLIGGLALLAAAVALGFARLGMTGHMTAHMLTVAVAAPLIAYGVAGTRFDLARLRLVRPMRMMAVEGIAVWSFHLPALRRFAGMSLGGQVIEQGVFLASGLLLWSAALGSRGADSMARRGEGVAAILMTFMHMTLLGALIGLAPRNLYPMHGSTPFGLDALADQQLGGAVMLSIGAGAYLAGGLWLLFELLRDRPARETMS